MKILKLNLQAFGPFTDFELDLSGGKEGLHIIYGPNEAGKTSAMRAIRNMFFGIPNNTPDNFTHEYGKLRVGGTVRHSDGSQLVFLRRKGRAKTLLSASGEPLDDDALNKYLMGFNEEIFSRVFGIGHEALVRGGREILEGGGDVGRALFSAGLGTGGINSLLNSLNEEARALFIPKGSNPSLNSNIKEYNDAKKKVANLSLSTREWAESDNELKAALSDLERLNARINALEKERNRLERIMPALPIIAQRRQILEKLAAMEGTVVLPDDFNTIRLETEHELRSAEKYRKELEIEIRALNDEKNSVRIPVDILERKAEIDALKDDLSVYRNRKKNRLTTGEKARRLKEEVQLLIDDIRPGCAVEDIGAMMPSAPGRTRIKDLAAKRSGLDSDIINSERKIRDTRKKIQGAEAARSELEPLDDPVQIGKAIKRVLKAGDIENEYKTKSGALEAARKQAEIELQRLGLWQGTLEELECAVIPSAETIDRFENETVEIETKIKGIKKEIRTIEKDVAGKEQKLEDLESGGKVPKKDMLGSKRARREQGWKLIKRTWLEGDDIAAEAEDYDTPLDLAAAYEKSVREADEIADRLLEDADRVAQFEELKSSLDGLARKLAKKNKTLSELEKQFGEINDEWKNTWRESNIEPLPPREMRSWRSRCESLLGKAVELREKQHELEHLEDKIELLKKDLLDCIAQLNRESDPSDSLSQILDFAESIHQDIESRREAHEKLSEKIEEYKIELDAARRDETNLKEELRKWAVKWESEMTAIGLSPDTEPSVAGAVIDALNSINNKLREAKAADEEITAIDNYMQEYEKELQKIIVEAAPHLKGNSTEAAVNTLAETAEKAKDDFNTLSGIEKQLDKKQQQLEKTRNSVVSATAILEKLCKQAGCDSADELQDKELLSDQFRQYKKELEGIERELTNLSAGGGLDAIIAEAEGQDADALEAALADIKTQLAALAGDDGERSNLEKRIGGIQAIINTMDGSAAAAEEDEKRMSLAAIIATDTERYVTLRLAHIILENQIRDFREKNQGPMLKRAGEIFSAITLDSFSGLATDFGMNDQQVLLGVRSGSGEKIETGVMSNKSGMSKRSGMSDGTLDQLFLALRMAYLERYLETKEPMPFIVDDILIQFDDDRALATLELLADFSKKVQILFFTHHARLRELAEKAGSRGDVFFHSIGN